MNLPLISQAFSGCQAPDVHICSGRILWCGAGRWQCHGSATVRSEIVREVPPTEWCAHREKVWTDAPLPPPPGPGVEVTGETWVYLCLCLVSLNLRVSRGIAWLEGRDTAQQAQSLDGICVHHHPLHPVTAEGWTHWLMAVRRQQHLLHQGLASSLRLGALVDNVWNGCVWRWIVGSQRDNVQAFICPLHDRVVWPFQMLLCASPRGNGGSLMRLRDVCIWMWCWRTTHLYPHWVRLSLPSDLGWALHAASPYLSEGDALSSHGIGTASFPSFLYSCCVGRRLGCGHCPLFSPTPILAVLDSHRASGLVIHIYMYTSMYFHFFSIK